MLLVNALMLIFLLMQKINYNLLDVTCHFIGRDFEEINCQFQNKLDNFHYHSGG